MKNFTGVWPALMTPLNENLEPDLTQLEKIIHAQIEEGLCGLYMLGSTGQGPYLTHDQRKTVAKRTVEIVDGKIPVMVHVGSNTTAASVDLAKHASEIGADATSSVGPIYFSLRYEMVFEHYRQIGAASNLPFFVYHLEMINSLNISPAEYVDQLMSIPNIAGMKYTGNDLVQFGLIRIAAAERLIMFIGADELLCQAVVSGATGAIGTYYNLWGKYCNTAWEKCMNGCIHSGRDFMSTFLPTIMEVENSGMRWSFFRIAMQRKFNVDLGPMIAPLECAGTPWTEPDVIPIMDRNGPTGSGSGPEIKVNIF